MSGFPNIKYHRNIAAAAPATADRFVFTAITEMRRSLAPKVEPGLKPIHPNRRMKVPVTTNTRLCAGKGSRLAIWAVLTQTRTEDNGERHGAKSSHGVDHGRPGEIDVTVG